MTHWGWYWKIKRKHKPKATCSAYRLSELDSFDFFRYKEGLKFVKESPDRLCFTSFDYRLKIYLMDDDSLRVVYQGGSYIIPVEKKPCNYGGFYRFFRCPQCNLRMRKLYCIKGRYLCRKCGNLQYYSQRLRPSDRYFYMMNKIEDKLKNRAGSLTRKPPWIKKSTFQKLRIQYVKYDEKRFYAINKELIAWRGISVTEPFPYFDMYFPPDDLYDAYIDRIESPKD